MKLSEIKGEDAIDVLAEIVEPVIEILSDGEIQALYKAHEAPYRFVKPALKRHKAAVISLLAGLELEDVEEYKQKVNILTLPKKLLELANDEDLIDFFVQQGLMTEGVPSSGSVTENTEEEA